MERYQRLPDGPVSTVDDPVRILVRSARERTELGLGPFARLAHKPLERRVMTLTVAGHYLFEGRAASVASIAHILRAPAEAVDNVILRHQIGDQPLDPWLSRSPTAASVRCSAHVDSLRLLASFDRRWPDDTGRLVADIVMRTRPRYFGMLNRSLAALLLDTASEHEAPLGHRLADRLRARRFGDLPERLMACAPEHMAPARDLIMLLCTLPDVGGPLRRRLRGEGLLQLLATVCMLDHDDHHDPLAVAGLIHQVFTGGPNAGLRTVARLAGHSATALPPILAYALLEGGAYGRSLLLAEVAAADPVTARRLHRLLATWTAGCLKS